MAYSREIWRWRIATTEAGLSNGGFVFRDIPIPIQGEPMDHTQKNSQSQGGVARHGWKTYKLLWPKLDMAQGADLRELVEAATELFLTAEWQDSGNPVLRFVDLKGKPDLSPMTPDLPNDARGIPTYSNVTLSLSNVIVVNDPADFS